MGTNKPLSSNTSSLSSFSFDIEESSESSFSVIGEDKLFTDVLSGPEETELLTDLLSSADETALFTDVLSGPNETRLLTDVLSGPGETCVKRPDVSLWLIDNLSDVEGETGAADEHASFPPGDGVKDVEVCADERQEDVLEW